MEYSIIERAKCAAWYEWTTSIIKVQRKFQAEFKKKSPTRNSILNWHKSLSEDGSVQNIQRKRRKANWTEGNRELVLNHFANNPQTSTRRAALAMSMSRTTIQRILKESKWYPSNSYLVQELYEEDKANRLQFAIDELARIEANPMHLDNLIWSEEAYFHLEDGNKSHNYPHWVQNEDQNSKKTTVWAAIGQRGVFGPFFFDENVTNVNYLIMLRDQFWPAIKDRGVEDKIIFMQDGAPSHWGSQVRNWLNKTFVGRWMGRGSSNMPWPPRSSDLTPCNFFLWGHIKSKVYATKPADMKELKQRIENAFCEITVEMLQKPVLEYKERLNKLIENNGSRIEFR